MATIHSIDGYRASALCFGCMQFGGAANQGDSGAMFEACREASVNFFDTAHTYTGGEAERLLGDFAKKEREKLIITTKAGYTGGSGRANILRQFDESRRRLETDFVDILYLHRWDAETPLEETFEVLCTLLQAGHIRHIGVSNFAAWQVMKAQATASQMDACIDIIQPMYSLVKRQAEVELFPMAVSERIAVASYSPLGSGLLTGKYLVGGTGRLSADKRYAARYAQEWMRETASAFSDLARRKGIDPATLAVAWAGHHPAVTAPIISARNVQQLIPSLAAQAIALSNEIYSQISALSPQPAPATDRLEEGMG